MTMSSPYDELAEDMEEEEGEYLDLYLLY
jgi:hypothetical protein